MLAVLTVIAGSKIRSIKLSTKSIGCDAAPVVAESIRNVANTLERADVSDIIAGRPEQEVLQVLQIVSGALAKCSKLLHVNISDNALGEKGIRACADVLKSSDHLEEIFLQNIGCSVNACKAVTELVTCTSLKVVHLFNNMSDNAGAAHIATLLSRNTSMEVCSISCMCCACTTFCQHERSNAALVWLVALILVVQCQPCSFKPDQCAGLQNGVFAGWVRGWCSIMLSLSWWDISDII